MGIIPWWVGTLFGAVVLVYGGLLQKSYSFSVKSIVIVMPVIFLASLGFWYGYQNSNRFLVAWFIGTAMCSLLAVGVDTFVLGKTWSMLTLVGVGLIVIGSFLALKY